MLTMPKIHGFRGLASTFGQGWSPLAWLLAAAASVLTTACAASPADPPEVASKIEIHRYLGTWHEIARLPFSRQEGCAGTTATYSLRDDGALEVVNRCRDGGLDGEERRAVGKAWVVDSTSNAKLKVQFFWPFQGDYWVLDVDPGYRWALVGTPDRRYLWILSRSATVDAELYRDLVTRAEAKGYPVERLIQTPQPTAATPERASLESATSES